VASARGFGMIPVVSPDFYSDFPSWVGTIFDSGISSVAIGAVVLNIIFNGLKAGSSQDPSVFAAKQGRYLTRSHLQDLEDGDVIVDGKLVDSDGEEIPIVPEEKLEEVKERIECGEVTTTQELVQVVNGQDSDIGKSES